MAKEETMEEKIKACGEFIYRYDTLRNTVTVADVSTFSSLSALNTISQRLSEYEMTDAQSKFDNLCYDNHLYLGITYKYIPEEELQEILS